MARDEREKDRTQCLEGHLDGCPREADFHQRQHQRRWRSSVVGFLAGDDRLFLVNLQSNQLEMN